MTAHAHDLAAHAHHEDDNDDAHNRAGERRTKWVIALTAAMMITELIIGHISGSLALTADGWHMGTHVGALGLTLGAYWYARTRAGVDAFSFGTGKIYALAGYTSAVVLSLVAMWMVYEGVDRLIEHPDVNFGEALPIAIAGLVVNGISARLLGHSHVYGGVHDHAHGGGGGGTLDFNLRAAYVHIVADALTSLVAIGALTIGRFTSIWYLDPMMGFVGGGVILWWAVSLCRQAGRQLLDAVSSPKHERLVRDRLEAIDDVKVADLHVWELGLGRRSCIVSIVTSTPRDLAAYRKVVLDAMTFSHLTIEVDTCALPHDSRDLEAAHSHEH